MYLDGQVLKINVNLEEKLAEIKKNLDKKFWKNYELTPPKLLITPYFYFFYHYYKLENNVISESFDGRLALNAVTLKIENSDLITKNQTNTDNKLNQEFIQEETLITKQIEKKILKYKASEYFKIPRTQIIISRIKKIFVPNYEIEIKIVDKKYKILVNATNGEITGFEKIPQREKNNLEITIDTLNDLKDPKSWIDYSKGLFKESKKELTFKKKFKLNLDLLTEKRMIFLIIIMGMILIYLSIFKL
jgi:5-hydroxyisourate hydrolase-like protein (transthyretin family)